MRELGGTGPLPTGIPYSPKPVSNGQTQTTPVSPSSPTGTTPPPPVDDQTQRRDSAQIEANRFDFNSTPQTLKTALNQPLEKFDQLSAAQQKQLNDLASALNFANGRTLVHALRNLNKGEAQAKLQTWMKTLPSSVNPQNQTQLHSAEAQLAQLAHQQIDQLFDQIGAPQPRFNPCDSRGRPQGDTPWTAAGYLAVFNAYSVMQEKMPDDLLKQLTSHNPEGMAFIRRKQPVGHVEHRNNFLEVLSNSMSISYSNDKDSITLCDAALSMDPEDVLKGPQVQDYLKELQKKHPDPDHIRSLQEMLNTALPPERQMKPPTGQLDDKTWSNLLEFETQQSLHRALDILKDNSQLNPKQKQDWAQKINNLLQKISQDGLRPEGFDWKGTAQTALKYSSPALVAYDAIHNWVSGEEPPPPPSDRFAQAQYLLRQLSQSESLDSSERQRLQASMHNLNQTDTHHQLRQEQLKMLISNWFGIIDTGDRFDFTEEVINHENGHILQAQKNEQGNTWLDSWQNISFSGFEQKPEDEAAFMKATLGNHFDSGFASDYARVNPAEDFAESFRTFTRQPEQLLKQNPLKFLFMAGATGTYEGREPELVQMIRDQGYNDGQIQDMVRSLRGQRAEYYTSKAKSLGDRVGTWLEQTANTAMPGLGDLYDRVSKYFEVNGWMADKASEITAHFTANLDHDFDLSVSTMLGGLESALKMDTSRVILPSQPGYVMDWLRQQHELMNSPNANPHQVQSASENLERFRKEGLNVFSDSIRKSISPEVQARFSDETNRVAEVILSKIAATPGIYNNWSDAVRNEGENSFRVEKAATQAIGYIKDSIGALKNGDLKTFVQNLIGEENYQALSPEARTILDDPRLVDLISGRDGRVNLSGDVIQRTLDKILDSRREAKISVQEDLANSGQGSYWIVSALQMDHQTGKIILSSDSYDQKYAYAALEKMYRSTHYQQESDQDITQKVHQMMASLLSHLNQAQGQVSVSAQKVNDSLVQEQLSELLLPPETF